MHGRFPRGALILPIQFEPLESRRLLSGNPAVEHVAVLPTEDVNIGVSFQKSLHVGDRVFLTAQRDNGFERLFALDDGAITELFQSTTWSYGAQIGIAAILNYHDRFYFFANGAAGDGLYTSDGTAAGTVPVKIFRQNTTNVLPAETVQLNDRFYFFWNDLNQPQRLYASDGTAAGTLPIWTPPHSYAHDLGPVIDGRHAFFTVDGDLWRTDGTAEGTQLAWDGPDTHGAATSFTVAGDRLYFIYKSFSRQELYVADLDEGNVRRISVPWGAGFGALTPVGDRVLFLAPMPTHMRLFSTDGTDEGTVQLAGGRVGFYDNELWSPITVNEGKAVFVQRSADPALDGLWATDGTPEGTNRILDGRRSPHLSELAAQEGLVYLRDASSTGIRTYLTDGTAEGTRLVWYVQTGGSATGWGGSYVTSLDGRLLVQGRRDGIPELWSLDPDVETGSITGFGFFDYNRNGRMDGFEQLLHARAYIDVDGDGQLDDEPPTDDVIRSTDNDARYLFDGLPVGEYDIGFRGYGNYKDLPIMLPPGGKQRVEVRAGETTVVDFSAWGPGAVVWGTVFHDRDGDGVRDPGEPGVGGEYMLLDINRNGFSDRDEPIVTTAQDGTFGFPGLAPGGHVVRRGEVPGWMQTSPPGMQPREVMVDVEGLVETSFGIIAAAPGTITGTVWTDWNRNGVRDAADAPRADAIIYIDRNNDGVYVPSERAGRTDWAGRFRLERVPGDYVIGILPEGLVQTSPPDSRGYAVHVMPGSTVNVGEFLVYAPDEVPPAGRITGRVWYDRDEDGLVDPDEPPVGGRVVYIDRDYDGSLSASDPVATTDADGVYDFPNRDARYYVLRQVLPLGWRQTSPADVGTYEFQLANGSHHTASRFGTVLIAPTVDNPGTIEEGGSLQLRASPGAGADPLSFTWTWDLNGDDEFSDATGPDPLLTWDDLKRLGIGDGPSSWPVRVRMASGEHHAQSAPVILNVTDVPPTLHVRGAERVLAGRPYRIDFDAVDPADDPVLSWHVDWGDRHAQILNANARSASHTYLTGQRTYEVTLTAVLEDGAYESAIHVRVWTPAEWIGDMIIQVLRIDTLGPGQRRSLLSKLSAADRAIADQIPVATSAHLRAFVRRLSQMRDELISPSQANELGDAASELLAIFAHGRNHRGRHSFYRPVTRR